MYSYLMKNDFQKNLRNYSKIYKVTLTVKGVNMKKKLMAGAITLLSVATLAACSYSSEGKDLIRMKGDVITEHQFFE